MLKWCHDVMSHLSIFGVFGELFFIFKIKNADLNGEQEKKIICYHMISHLRVK